MKIKLEHYNHMKTEIENLLANEPDRIKRYETWNFPRADKVHNLQSRFNWDLFCDAGLSLFACDELYSYANDHHIATALKRICPKITDRYAGGNK